MSLPREEGEIFTAVASMLDTRMDLCSITNFQKSLPNHDADDVFIHMKK
jgi:hypothetical protein